MLRTQSDVSTSQNVVVSYPLANYGERLLAGLIDWIILFAAYLLILSGGVLSMFVFGSVFAMILPYLPILIYILYFTLWEVLRNGQTPGKLALSIQVIKADGTDLRWSEMFVRALCLLPDQLFSLGTVGTVLINTTPRRQRLGDIAAGTIVVKKGASQITMQDLLAIQTTSSYTPKYPQVRELTEKDMLFIKSVIVRTDKYRNAAHDHAVIELTEHLRERLNIEKIPAERLDFLRTLLKDYVVLTR
jgi:uncharacterized RDD family membrane protein YckC